MKQTCFSDISYENKKKIARKEQFLVEITAQYLSERGLLLSEGTIVDVTIISVSSSTKNQIRKVIISAPC